MSSTKTSFLIALLAIGTLGVSAVQAVEDCLSNHAKSAQETVNGLIDKYDSANEKLVAISAEDRAKMAAEVGQTAQKCPIGRRVGETVAFVQEALAASAAAERDCAEICPSKKEAGCAKLQALAKSRSSLLCSLKTLASRTGAATTGDCRSKSECASKKATVAKGDFCGKKAQTLAAAVRGENCAKANAELLIKEIAGLKCSDKAQELAANVKKAGCDKSAAKLIIAAATGECASKASKSDCVQSLLARAKTLKECWAKAPAEYATLEETTRNEIRGKVASFQGPIALVRPSIFALEDGVGALVRMNARMKEAAEKDENLLKGISEDMKKRFQANARLMAETHAILKSVRATMESAMPKKS